VDHGEPQPWTRRSRRRLYENAWMALDEDQVDLPNGHRTTYGIVRCGECVGALPFVDDEHVLLVQQWRYIFGRTAWEMPTGGMHDGEDPPTAVQRELAEEAGVRAGRLEPVTSVWTSKSVVDETAHLFLARDLEPAEAQPDATELIVCRTFPFSDVLGMVLDGEIIDAMTVIAVLVAARG